MFQTYTEINIFVRFAEEKKVTSGLGSGKKEEDSLYRLFFLRTIAQFFTQIYMNCFVSS